MLLGLWLAPAAASGQLLIDTPHYGLVLSVDGQPRGHTPVPAIALTPGLHAVDLSRGGQALWSRVVYVPASGLHLRVVIPGLEAPLERARAGAVPKRRDTLRGRAGVEGARAGSVSDLEVLTALAVETGKAPWHGSLRLRSFAGLSESKLLRRLHRSEASLRLEEARVGATVGAFEGELGRRELGFAERTFRSDGAQVGLALSPLRVELGAGHSPELDAWVGRLQADYRLGDAALRIREVLVARHHLEGELRWAGLLLGGRLVGLEGAEARLRGDRWGAWVEVAALRATGSPFDAALLPLEVPVGDAERARLGWRGGEDLHGGAQARGRWGEGSADSPREVELSGDVEARVARWRIGAEARWLHAEARGPGGLGRHAAGLLRLGWASAHLRLQAAGGLSRSASFLLQRWLPEAAVAVEWQLVEGLALALEGSTGAVHPHVAPELQLSRALLELRLR